MKKLLNHSKWVYYILGILSALIIISSLFFMTQYKFVRVNYIYEDKFVLDESGEPIIDNVNGKPYVDKDGKNMKDKNGKEYVDENGNPILVKTIKVKAYLETAQLNGASQTYLFEFVNDIAYKNYGKDAQATDAQAILDGNSTIQTFLKKDDSDQYVNLVEKKVGSGFSADTKYVLKDEILVNLDNFRTKLDSYNTLILWYGIISLIMFAGLLILSNHNRRIYYIGNVVGGVLLPLVNVVLVLVLAIQAFGLMSNISNPDNNAIYNIISTMQNPTLGSQNVGIAASQATNVKQINNIINAFNVNSTTIVMYLIFFVITAAYNVFLIIYAIMKYNATAKERKEVLEKARLAGDNA